MLIVALLLWLWIVMVLSVVPSNFDAITNVGGTDIGWIEVFSCPETSSGSIQTFANSLSGADYFPYFEHVIAIQLLPLGTTPSDHNFDSPTDSFAVMADVCSIPVVALNNNLDLSWPIDPNTLQNPGSTADITYINNNYLGTQTAVSRYVQGDASCSCPPRNPTQIYDASSTDGDYYIYWACCNHGGVHLTRDQCSLDYQDDLEGIDGTSFWLGFDKNARECCIVDGGDPYLDICPSLTPEPTTPTPTECGCQYSVDEYLRNCYCDSGRGGGNGPRGGKGGRGQRAEVENPFIDYNNNNNDGYDNYNDYNDYHDENIKIDPDQMVKLLLPISVFYVLLVLVIVGVLTIFGGFTFFITKTIHRYQTKNETW